MKKQRSREHDGGCTYQIRIGITLNLVQNENDNSDWFLEQSQFCL